FLSESRFLFQVDLSYYWLILIGGVLGIIGGIFGIGLGFLVLPVIVILYKVPIKKAIGSSLFCAGTLTIGALIPKVYTIDFGPFLIIAVMVVAAIGTIFGGITSVIMKSNLLQNIVAIILIVVSIR